LTELLQKNTLWNWGNEQERAFSILKEELCKEPILAYPDFSQEFILTTDASAVALGGILSQMKDGKEHPVSYTSRTFNKAERNYSPIERELKAIVWRVKHFRPYLYGRKFKIITDHRALVWLMNLEDPHSKLFRWKTEMEEFEFEIIYKKGSLNTNADALSRNPILMYQHNDENESTETASESEET